MTEQEKDKFCTLYVSQQEIHITKEVPVLKAILHKLSDMCKGLWEWIENNKDCYSFLNTEREIYPEESRQEVYGLSHVTVDVRPFTRMSDPTDNIKSFYLEVAIEVEKDKCIVKEE